MGKDLKIKHWKQWWLVQRQGYTIAQFLSHDAAVEYKAMQRSPFAAAEAGLGNEYVSQRKGRTIRQINVYPNW